ncbi:sugar transferase [Pedobacter mendelii]|nr:sugar transferase [Pedobacter mendelii]
MSHRYSKHLSLIVYLTDLIVLNLSIVLVSHFYLGDSFWSNKESVFLLLVSNISWGFLSFFRKNFVVHRPLVLSNNINNFTLTLVYHIALVFCLLYISEIFDISKFVLLSHLVIFFALIIIQRSSMFFLLDYIRKKGYNHRRVLIIGKKNIAIRLKQSFKRHPEYGYDIVGYISDESLKNFTAAQLNTAVVNRRVDELYVCNLDLSSDTNGIMDFFLQNKTIIKVVSDMQFDVQKAEYLNYNELPVFRLLPHAVQSLKIRLLKRGFDLGFASSVMFCGMPVFMLIVAITKCTSKGPIFYKQQRIGRNGKPFYIYKFRSMYIDAEKMGPQLSKDNDPRITKWGRIMRKTRLDELPQFYNVFRGDMSVVGPRPERQHFIEQIIERAPQYSNLLSIKPGITSIGQVKYGYAENVDQMVERMSHDLVYLGKLKLRTDVSVIFDTVKVMVAGKGK